MDAFIGTDAHFKDAAAAADEFEKIEAAFVDGALVFAKDAVEFGEGAVGDDEVGNEDDNND